MHNHRLRHLRTGAVFYSFSYSFFFLFFFLTPYSWWESTSMNTWWNWHIPGLSLPWESILSGALETGTTWWCGGESPGFRVSPPGWRSQPSHYHLRPMIAPGRVSVFPSKKWDSNVWWNIMWVILTAFYTERAHSSRACSFPACAFLSFYVKQPRTELCQGNRMLSCLLPFYTFFPFEITIDSPAAGRNCTERSSIPLPSFPQCQDLA